MPYLQAAFLVRRPISLIRRFTWIVVVGSMCGGMPEMSEARENAPAELRLLPVLEQYCVKCHGAGEVTEGDVELTGLSREQLQARPELLQQLIDVLQDRVMPPEDARQPPDETFDSVLRELRPLLHEAIAKSTVHIRTPIRRMNRFQYNNAVVDLFELNCIVFTLPERAMRVHRGYFDPARGQMPPVVTVGNRPLGKSQMIEPRLAGVAAFPQDLRAEHGYDNRGDHLSLSPLLMDEFLKLGQSITQSPDFGPKRVGIWDRFFQPPVDLPAAAAAVELREGVRQRLLPFLTKAFRRPPEEALLDRYVGFVLEQLEAGMDFTTAMKSVAGAALASPRFLYLYNGATGGDESDEARPLDDWELASRLSFFLWGSLPDETLLSLAANGTLSDPIELEKQVERMLDDKKLKRFCDSFPTQWLQLDRIVSSVPNPELFPSFYFSKYRLSMHMMLEPLLLFETVLIEDLPITQLIDSDFTYRSAKLEQAYGPLGNKPGRSSGGGVTMLTFHRVPVTDRRSGGVITSAAVMTMTSGPERTQPITRGAWIASVIFNRPPDPPPANVPPLPEKPQAGEEHLTLRQRLAAHRKRADCRGCHEQIDPLGFALENYNPIGVWRDRYPNGLPIDASGDLFRKASFRDVVEFKDAILADKERFCRAFGGHMLSFALARELGPADKLALERITERVAAEQYSMQSLIREIILSEPFRTKR